MTSSLVGSEMCIRDRNLLKTKNHHFMMLTRHTSTMLSPMTKRKLRLRICLLYTSDAADDM
eukprot:12786295-Prorocentrum_lima.AAC.1